jgi:transposase-like protein
MRCRHCDSEQTVKDGKNGSGSQRYKCKSCQRHFTPEPNEIGYPVAVRQEAVAMYVDGQNYRRTGRNLRVNDQSVANWVKAAAQKALDAPLPRPVVDEDTVVEVDELFTFVQNKKTKRSSSPKSIGKRAVS